MLALPALKWRANFTILETLKLCNLEPFSL